MSLPAWSQDPDPPAAGPPDAKAAAVLALPRRKRFDPAGAVRRARGVAGAALPPVVALAAVLLVWQGLSAGGQGLPAPTTIWLESRDLILDPFFDRGGVDKGLFWHALTSLK